MRDYKNKFDENESILRYKIKEDKIIVYLAGGSKLIYDYSIAKEKEILKQMESQVSFPMIIYSSMQDKKARVLKKWLTETKTIALASLLFKLLGLDYFIIISGLSLAGVSIPLINKLIGIELDLKDLEKNTFFLDNKEIINNTLKEKDIRKENLGLTINSVQNKNLRELKALISNCDYEKRDKALMLVRKK